MMHTSQGWLLCVVMAIYLTADMRTSSACREQRHEHTSTYADESHPPQLYTQRQDQTILT
jgi:hypothetical protein